MTQVNHDPKVALEYTEDLQTAITIISPVQFELYTSLELTEFEDKSAQCLDSLPTLNSKRIEMIEFPRA